MNKTHDEKESGIVKEYLITVKTQFVIKATSRQDAERILEETMPPPMDTEETIEEVAP